MGIAQHWELPYAHQCQRMPDWRVIHWVKEILNEFLQQGELHLLHQKMDRQQLDGSVVIKKKHMYRYCAMS